MVYNYITAGSGESDWLHVSHAVFANLLALTALCMAVWIMIYCVCAILTFMFEGGTYCIAVIFGGADFREKPVMFNT